MAKPILSNRLSQIGFVVRDIETARVQFARLLGVDPPSVCDGGDYSVTRTVVEGQPAPDANCLMAFFDLENIQLELIQPNGVKSVWQDYLNQHGEGLHHIAFQVKDTEEKIKTMEENFGTVCLQRGKYGNGNGEYAYLDARNTLTCLVETLEKY